MTQRSTPNRFQQVERLESRLAPATARFAVVGDYGAAGQPEADVAALVRSWNPDLIITVGDNNYPTGSAATIDANIGQYYHDFIGNYVGGFGAGSPVNRFFPTLGSHDWQTRSGTPALPTPYLNYFTLPGNERYYTFTQGPVQFFALDSGNGAGDDSDGFEPDGFTSTSVQGQWLRSQLAASTAVWKIVYFHHAPYSSGASGSSPIMRWPFREWGATAVLSGDDHDYERLTVDGLPYFVNGLGGESAVAFTGAPLPGSQVRYAGNFGAMRVDATDTGITFQFVSRSGSVVDTYTIQAAGLPTVSITATDATAAEPGADTGTFTVSRTGSTAAALTVNLSVGGTAVHGGDYMPVGGTVTIPAGAASATIRVTPIDDPADEGSETAILWLAPGSGYTVGSANTATVTILDNDSAQVGSPIYAVGAGPGGGGRVVVYNADGSARFAFAAFGGFNGEVRVATGDVTGDGQADVIAAAGPGGGPHVRVFDGMTGTVVREFFAYSPGFSGGVFVAAGDVTGDGRADIVVGPGAGGGPHVRVFNGATGAEVVGFFAFDGGFFGGLAVAAGDITGDGRADVIVGAGPGGGPHVKVFDGATLALGGSAAAAAVANPLRSFFAFPAAFRGGVFVATGDVNNDGRRDIVLGAGPGGGPHVRAVSGVDGSELLSFFPFGSFAGGVRVAARDLTGSTRSELIVTVGPGGGPHVRVLNAGTLTDLRSFFAFDPAFLGGVFVG